MAGDSSNDYSVFASADFDPNEYANAVLAGETYPATGQNKQKLTRSASGLQSSDVGKEDISVALAKLTYGIDDVSQQLRNVVTTHHEALLSEAASVHQLEGSLHAVRQGLVELSSSLEKLRLKIRVPYQNLSALVTRLQRLQLAADVLRRTSRFVLLARRLEFQMNELAKFGAAVANGKQLVPPVSAVSTTSPAIEEGIGPEGDRERNIAKAAISIAELTSLSTPESAAKRTSDSLDALPPIPLRSINAVVRHLPGIEAARVKITEEMENMLRDGLEDLNQSLLASSLQTAHNLRVLPELIHDVVDEIKEHVENRIKYAFDVTRISKDSNKDSTPAVTSLMYRSRVRTEPTNINAAQWTAALWARLEGMVEELASSCIKESQDGLQVFVIYTNLMHCPQVYTLEKVLRLKKDTATKAPFLEEVLKTLDNKPSSIFWMTMARILETQSRESAKASSFIQQTLSNGYPRLLRLFHDFFLKIGFHTDTIYSQSYQSPETVLVLRAITNFEALYLSRSSNRLTEAVGTAVAGGARAPPGMAEGVAVARTVANELDSARFDPLLVKAVAKSVASALDIFLARVDALTTRDRSATTLIGPGATTQEAVNAQLTSALYNCWLRLSKLDGEYHKSVVAIVDPAVQNMKTAYEKITEPLLLAIRHDLTAIASRLHRVDFGKAFDPEAGVGGPSLYMRDMVDKLTFVRDEILGRFVIGDLARTWVVGIVRRVIRSFVLNASLAKPLGESGKLQLTSDMTEFEFALNAFMMQGGSQNRNSMRSDAIAEDYMALRALRPLLFLDNASLALEDRTVGLPPLIVLHHILVRSPLPLPHAIHGWKVEEYVRWVDEHTEQEAFTLIEGCLARWEATCGEDERVSGEEYVTLARSVLVRSASNV
ncbi:hypothetical protein FRB94_007800 [Tulasnella sp. JGI-2019a]|nr:hypothetical protein FRB93_004333 [Tulasnella sp. JGI-2019a]KAG8997229.1 hypothetical protein FRB94_007800 [Tulasnella sp. JGI-2019a]KAG9027853.1 hypothetical protein FRB95_007334 [Tulasnella sp. JGI-2019a]